MLKDDLLQNDIEIFVVFGKTYVSNNVLTVQMLQKSNLSLTKIKVSMLLSFTNYSFDVVYHIITIHLISFDSLDSHILSSIHV